MSELRRTPLFDLHRELGARMVPFAGYDMPVQYPEGVLKEHLHTRSAAGLFDVSHMGQVHVSGTDPARALERLVPVDVEGLALWQQRYALFTDSHGGILDDLMITRVADGFFVVVNAACKEADLALLHSGLSGDAKLKELGERALLALQGPAAAAVFSRLAPAVDLAGWVFMSAREVELVGVPCLVTRSGYTGEDGFEISVPADAAEKLARAILREPEVHPIGLGARDSLRLEAGLCLYGQDIDTSTSPIEAQLAWALSKSRRADGTRPGGYPGADVVLRQMKEGVPRKRVGLLGLDRTPVRPGAALVDGAGVELGRVTSGGFGPSVGAPIAMGYVASAHAAPESEIFALVRERRVPLKVARTPFFPQRYYRG